MKLEKNNWVLPVIAVLYLLSALWTSVSKLISGLLSSHADSTAVFIFSYINNTIDAVILGACLALALGIASSSASGKMKTAFKLGMSSSIVVLVYFLLYLLFASSYTILYVDLVLITVYGTLSTLMFIILSYSGQKNLRIAGAAASCFVFISAAAEFMQIFSSVMIIGKGNVLFWMKMITKTVNAGVFCSIIRGVVCGMFFFLARSEN